MPEIYVGLQVAIPVKKCENFAKFVSIFLSSYCVVSTPALIPIRLLGLDWSSLSHLCFVSLDCRHFKEKMRHQSKKEEVKWNFLVNKVQTAKIAMRLFSSQRSSF